MVSGVYLSAPPRSQHREPVARSRLTTDDTTARLSAELVFWIMHPRQTFRWPAVAERARPLLALLFDDLESGERINLRGLRDGRAWNRFARTPDEALGIVHELVGQPGTDVLLGVLPRAGEDGTSRGLRRGTCLWVDVDPRGDADGATTAWRRLARFPVQPSAVVHSGRGLHAYWRLGSSIALAEPSERHRFGEALRRLAHALGGDPTATDLPRVLRLPGSLNWKYAPPRPVTVLAVRPGQCPELDAMLDVLPPLPPLGTRQTVKSVVRTGEHRPVGETNGAADRATDEDRWVSRLLLHGAGQGQRNAACARLAGYLLSRGLPPDVARAIVLSFAARCHPPLPPAEVERVIRSIARYHRHDARSAGSRYTVRDGAGV